MFILSYIIIALIFLFFHIQINVKAFFAHINNENHCEIGKKQKYVSDILLYTSVVMVMTPISSELISHYNTILSSVLYLGISISLLYIFYSACKLIINFITKRDNN